MNGELKFHSTSDPEDGQWAAFAAATAGRGPLEYFQSAMEFVDGNRGAGRQAIDLGCGGGADTRALLARGWRVLAVDAEPGADRLVSTGLTDSRRELLDISIGRFHEVALPPADLVYAQFSLPFAGQHFERSVEVALEAVIPGGAFVGQLFGVNDDWVAEEGAVVVDRSWVDRTFDRFEHTEFEEQEFDAPYGTDGGTRHFHFFDIRARR
jgi:SAM-dependent methyltransferase